ncbi:hypothetical protein Asp14428_76560 [Actinoplanes sp. NBRC 14428]|nr:hypothetical protein Asp14428_76560 [Actinoplanes sp. NBRC 14428]
MAEPSSTPLGVVAAPFAMKPIVTDAPAASEGLCDGAVTVVAVRLTVAFPRAILSYPRAMLAPW